MKVVGPVDDLPRWFTISLATAVVFVAAAGFGTVALLGLGIYHPALALALAGGAAGVVGFVVARRVKLETSAAPGAAIAAIAIALAFFAFNGAFHSEHVLTDRDPAIYMNTGRAIARSHELHPRIRTEPFQDGRRYTMTVPSMGEVKGKLVYTFFPMLPALLALGGAVGGDTGMLLVGAALGALGLLVAYALAARVAGPRWALVVPVFLTVNPLPGWFARDAYSELVVGVVFLGGIWLYLAARPSRSVSLAAVAGAVAATSFLARIDAIVMIVGVVLFAGIEWLAGRDRDTPPDRRAVTAFAAALLGVTYLCGLLADNAAHKYIDNLRDKYDSQLKLLYAAIAVVVIAALVDRLVPSLRTTLARLRTPLAIALTAIAVAAVTWAYFVRPRPRSVLPVNPEGVPLTKEFSRALHAWHRTQTMHWFGDWFGPLTMAVAFIGLILLGWWALRGNTTALAIVLLTLPLTAIFLVRPSITMDQPWAMRRFLPLAIPAVAIGLAVVGRVVWTATREIKSATWRAVAVGGIVVACAVLIAPSANAARPLLQARNQHGALGAIHELCRVAGPDGAVISLGNAYLDAEWPQTLRGFCGIPVSRPDPRNPNPDIAELARATEDGGRTLFILTSKPDEIRSIPGIEATERAHVVVDDRFAPEQKFGGRSDVLVPVRPREAWLFEVEPFPQPEQSTGE